MIATLAKILGLSPEHAEASIHSERAARAVLSRRNLFAAGAALAAGSAFSFAKPQPEGFYVQNPHTKRVMDRVMGEVEYWCEFTICGVRSPGVVGIADRVWIVPTPKELLERLVT
jgi:hypothetical protein